MRSPARHAVSRRTRGRSGALRRSRLTERPVSGPPRARPSTHCTTGQAAAPIAPDDAASGPVRAPSAYAVPRVVGERSRPCRAPQAPRRWRARSRGAARRRRAAVEPAPASPPASPRACGAQQRRVTASRSRPRSSASGRASKRDDEEDDRGGDDGGRRRRTRAAAWPTARHSAAVGRREVVGPVELEEALRREASWCLEALGQSGARARPRARGSPPGSARGRRAAGRRARRPAGRRRCPSAGGPRPACRAPHTGRDGELALGRDERDRHEPVGGQPDVERRRSGRRRRSPSARSSSGSRQTARTVSAATSASRSVRACSA